MMGSNNFFSSTNYFGLQESNSPFTLLENGEEREPKETCHFREGIPSLWSSEYQLIQLSSVTNITGLTANMADLASLALYSQDFRMN